jgi:3-methyladenine DNA glycosylase AlkD
LDSRKKRNNGVCGRKSWKNDIKSIPLQRKFCKDLAALAQSGNLWKRRFAASTMANLNHGGRQFRDETLAIVKLLQNDKELMVKKAVVWALKEINT